MPRAHVNDKLVGAQRNNRGINTGTTKGKHTLILTVVPKATSNLHSDPRDRLICVGGAGTYCDSADGSASSKPGRDIALLVGGHRKYGVMGEKPM